MMNPRISDESLSSLAYEKHDEHTLSHPEASHTKLGDANPPSNLPELEKAVPANSISPKPTLDWDSQDDPDNPQNWSRSECS